MKLNDCRIFVFGPSGTGKSTLANWISERYEIPYITTSSKPLWDKYGIKKHTDIITMSMYNPLMGLKFQCELLETRKQIIQDNNRFVTDRSAIDNLVYFLLQNSPFLNEQDTINYIHEIRSTFSIMMNDWYIHLGFNTSIKLEDDGKRINNPHYQLVTQSIYDLVNLDYLHDCLDKRYTELMTWDFTDKTILTNEFFEKNGLIIP